MHRQVTFYGTEYWSKIWRKTYCAFKNDMRKLAKFHQSTRKSQNWVFDGILLSKVENEWAKNVKSSYVSWQWRMMQNLKRNWLSVQNWLEEFDKFWPEHSKFSKICTLMGCFWPEYIILELKRYWGVIFDCTEDWYQIWKKTDLCFQKWREKFGKFGWKIGISF